uniref:BTB domain-containing protein n=1 Tax=Panagrellus redivivus TaxID=6233 RepID=A0A7E4V7U1_PANRE
MNTDSIPRKIRLLNERNAHSVGKPRPKRVKSYHDLGICIRKIHQVPYHNTVFILSASSRILLWLQVHRHFVSMISPVLRSCFDGPFNREVEILGFKRKTVENVLNFCYGSEVVVLMQEIINMLRFADEYDIAFVTQALKNYLSNKLSFQNYGIIAKYAWDLNDNATKNACIQFYALYQDTLKLTYICMTLNPQIRADIEQRVGQHQYNGRRNLHM